MMALHGAPLLVGRLLVGLGLLTWSAYAGTEVYGRSARLGSWMKSEVWLWNLSGLYSVEENRMESDSA